MAPGAVTYEGVTFFQDRSNTSTAKLVGTDRLDLEGALYFSAAKADVGGTGDGFGNQLIADMIEVNGTGEITIMYDGRFPALRPGGTPWPEGQGV